MTTHALTIDLEDWHQLFHRRVKREIIPPSNTILPATHLLLDILDTAGVKATFFTLGILAEHLPLLVKEVARRGHEIASHSYSHQLIGTVTRDAFKKDMEQSIKQLEDLTGQRVRGFRAPEFSVGHLKHWCFDVLAELEIDYDSSVFPLPGARYGIADAPRKPFVIETPSGRIKEFPLATWRARKMTLPVAGGTYFRLLPASMFRRAFSELDAAGHTQVLYFHPYEFYRGWLLLSGIHWTDWLRPTVIKYTMLHNFMTGLISSRLLAALREFRFAPLGELAAGFVGLDSNAVPTYEGKAIVHESIKS